MYKQQLYDNSIPIRLYEVNSKFIMYLVLYFAVI